MFDRHGNKPMKYEKSVILERIKANKKEHNEIYIEALDGYKDKVLSSLKNALDKATDDKEYITNLRLDKPVNHLTDYDRAITMLEMTNETIIEMTAHDFSQFIMDEWDWKENFLMSNSGYSAKAMKLSSRS